MSIPSSTTAPPRRSGRGRSIGIGIILVIVAIVLVIVGRSPELIPTGRSFGSPTTVRAVIGSEKRPFFEDRRVQEYFLANGYDVEIRTAGSREIARDTDLSEVDFVFPSSAPAGEKIARDHQHQGVYTPFFSPMVVATFDPIVGILAKEGVIREENGRTVLDVQRYLDISNAGTRWEELGPEFPSPRVVQISTTDIRSSNSAAMYLTILANVANGAVPEMAEVDQIATAIAPQFVGQGYTGSTSAEPFNEYLSQGMGSKPLVMVYEAQYLGEQLSHSSRIRPDMQMVYPNPTVLSNHTIVALTSAGDEVARLLTEDPELQRLAAEHGFRTQNPDAFAQVVEQNNLEAPDQLPHTVATPSFEVLEKLIDAVSADVTGVPRPE